MHFLLERIRELGGAATTAELYAAGAHRAMLRAAVREKLIRRVRQGWYIDPDTPASVADALRVGGRATCVTTVELLGLWIREVTREVHAAVAPNACRLRDPRDYRHRLEGEGAVVHWCDDGGGSSRLTVPLPLAIIALAHCRGLEAAYIAAESALHRGLMGPAEWSTALAGAPADISFALLPASGLSGSITESIFVFRLRRLGIRLRQQVQIGPDRVDGVIGRWLVCEIDSREFHDPERDHARDARLSARGYRQLRFTYRQIMHDWPSVEASVLAALSRDDHR